MTKNSNSLIIGDTSQVSYYLDPKIERINSRSIPESVYSRKWDRVYVCFAEQRTIYANNSQYKKLFFDTNVKKTLEIINKIQANSVVIFSTTELWNRKKGPIYINTPFDFHQNYYTDSKYELTKHCQNDERIKIIYPFNFNSIHRSQNFLFGKIFSSIINKEKVTVGSLNFRRELLHTSFIAKVCEQTSDSCIIGTGELTSVKNFINDLYQAFTLDINDYVSESVIHHPNPVAHYAGTPPAPYSYEDLLEDTVNELQYTARQRHRKS